MNNKAFNIYIDDKIVAYIQVPNTGEYLNWATVHCSAVKIKKDGRTTLKIQAGGMDLDECDLYWIEFVEANPKYTIFDL